MPAPSIKETLQSAQQVQAAATKIIQAIQDLERIREQRDGIGSVQFDQLTAAQLEQLGIIDYSQINKLVDAAPDLRDGFYGRAVSAQSIGG